MVQSESFAFALNYENHDFIVQKSNINFIDGYGIVMVSFINDDDEEEYLVGVVDKNYKEVLPLTSMYLVPKLNIAPKGNFIFTTYIIGKDEYEVMHFDIEGNAINLKACDFRELDKEVFILYYDEYATLYDVQTKTNLTPFYTYLGEFVYSDKYKCKVAKVAYNVTDDNGNVIDEVSTVINTKGEVLEDYYSLAYDCILASKDLTNALELVRKRNK